MAIRATKANVQRTVEGPDFEAAYGIITGRVADAKNKQSKASGDASAAWKDVEKTGANRAGAQMFAKILNVDDDDGKRTDMLRTFSKLCEIAGISIPADLVDEAEGKQPEVVPTEKPAGPAPETVAAPPSDDSDLAGDPPAAAEPVADKPKKGRPRLSVVEAQEQARSHLTGTATPDAMH